MVAKKTKTRTRPSNQSIDTILKNIEKAMGNSTEDLVIKKGSGIFEKVQTISFGYPEVDKASNCGGVPKGKLVEIFGPESSGKSLLTLKLIANCQKSGEKCCLVDAEQSYDPIWADSHGVDTEDLYIINKALCCEKILDYVYELCNSGGFGLVVVDSTAALVPEKELEGSVSDDNYALLARAMSKGCKKIVNACAETKCTCVFINQIREKMNVMWGNPETTPGGKALKFYSHQRISVRGGAKVKITEGNVSKVIARKSKVTFVKNKAAIPYGECDFEIVFDHTARNPLVKLCKEAKDCKVVSIFKGTYRLNKDLFEDAKKNVDTELTTIVELADYLVRNDLVQKVLDFLIKRVEEDEEHSGLSDDILALKNPENVISPMDVKEDDLDDLDSDKLSNEDEFDILEDDLEED